MDPLLLTLIIIGVLTLLVAVNAPKVAQEYERGVVFFLGRLRGARGPGLFFIFPFLERVVKVDLRTVTLEIPAQETITRDNVSVRVNAVLYFRVYDPSKAVVNITDFVRATLQIAQTTLRSVLGQSELDEVLSQRDKLNQELQQIIDEQTEPWGIKVSTVEIKDVELPATMQRAMARQAEAEREKRAKIIHAEGEFQASKTLAEAAKVMGKEKQAIQLRYLQTLSEIATEKNSTIIFPLPMDLLTPFLSPKEESPASTTQIPHRASLEARLERRKRLLAETQTEIAQAKTALPAATPATPPESKVLPPANANGKGAIVFDRTEQELVAVAANDADTKSAIPPEQAQISSSEITTPELPVEEARSELVDSPEMPGDEAEQPELEATTEGEAADASPFRNKKKQPIPQPVRSTWIGKKR